MKTVSYGHSEMAGREFKADKEDFMWYVVASSKSTFFCKMDGINYAQAKEGKPFEVWHMFMPTEEGIAPMCINSKTIEPWLVVNASYIAEVHPSLARELDGAFEEMTRRVTLATINGQGQMTKKPTKLEIVRE